MDEEILRSSISWRAIFAGFFISILTYLILGSLGLAIGGASLQGVIRGGLNVGGLGLGSAIWAVVSVFISLFVGAYFAGRSGGLIASRLGTIQGYVISALFFSFAISGLGNAIGALGQSAGSVVGSVGGTAADLARNPRVQDIVGRSLSGLNLKSPPDVVIQGVTTRLMAGNPTDAKNYLARQAGITPERADRIITDLQSDFQNAVRDLGVQAAKVATIAGWTLFFATVLGTVFAALGGKAGASANLMRPTTEADRSRLKRVA